MSWILTIFFLSFTLNNLSEAVHHEKKLPSAVVVGTVYCDTCFQENFSKTSHFISGASIAVECREGNLKPNFVKEVKTDQHGKFKVHLPFSVAKHVKKIEGCSVKLIRSSEPYCAVASTAAASSLHLKSRKPGTHIFSAGFFTFKPLTQPNLCTQKPKIKNSREISTQKSLLPPVQDPTTPPPQPPTPPSDLPPLPLLPKLPPLPPLPQLPPLPPLPGFPGFPPVPEKTQHSKSTKSSETFYQTPQVQFLPPVPKKTQLSKSIESSEAFLQTPQVQFFPPNLLHATPLLPPNPFQPPSLLLPQNPFQPPSLLLPPNPFQLPPLLPNPFQPPPTPLTHNPLQPRPAAPLIPLPPLPGLGLTPSPPSVPSFPFPLPPFPFPPAPRIPGKIPPASSSSMEASP